MEWKTTSEILERLRDQDDHAVWNGLTERLRPPLVAFGRRSGLAPGEAEDAAQETLLSFMRSYRDGKYDRSKARLSSWLFGIAFRVIQEARRRAGRQQRNLDPRGARTNFLDGVPDDREATRAWDEEWEKALVERCLAEVRQSVAESSYRAFDLVVRKGRDPDEVAEQLGMTRNAVYIAKHRVLKRLGELIREFEDLPG